MNLLGGMRYLAALDEHRHFVRAAQACHITPSALSNALRALETGFGVTIVRRGRQFGGLTSEGEHQHHHGVRLENRLHFRAARGAVFVPFASYEAAANLMTNSAHDPFGKIPEFKHRAIQVIPGGVPPQSTGYGTGSTRVARTVAGLAGEVGDTTGTLP